MGGCLLTRDACAGCLLLRFPQFGPVSMISFRNFALRRGERLQLSKVDIALHDGWRVGVIGRNDRGKTSLVAAILGEVEADSGDRQK